MCVGWVRRGKEGKVQQSLQTLHQAPSQLTEKLPFQTLPDPPHYSHVHPFEFTVVHTTIGLVPSLRFQVLARCLCMTKGIYTSAELVTTVYCIQDAERMWRGCGEDVERMWRGCGDVNWMEVSHTDVCYCRSGSGRVGAVQKNSIHPHISFPSCNAAGETSYPLSTGKYLKCVQKDYTTLILHIPSHNKGGPCSITWAIFAHSPFPCKSGMKMRWGESVLTLQESCMDSHKGRGLGVPWKEDSHLPCESAGDSQRLESLVWEVCSHLCQCDSHIHCLSPSLWSLVRAGWSTLCSSVQAEGRGYANAIATLSEKQLHREHSTEDPLNMIYRFHAWCC